MSSVPMRLCHEWDKKTATGRYHCERKKSTPGRIAMLQPFSSATAVLHGRDPE
jgi:hypothetical protein